MFSSVVCSFAFTAKEALPNPMPQKFIFYSKSFIVLALTFKSLLHCVDSVNGVG